MFKSWLRTNEFYQVLCESPVAFGEGQPVGIKWEKFLDLRLDNIMTSLCYGESHVGRVYLLLGINLESIEFYQKG